TNTNPMKNRVRACLKIIKGAVFAESAVWRGATKENIPCGSLTEEQRSQTVFSVKTLRASSLLPVACVGSAVTARCGDAPASPPWPQSKSLAAAPLRVFKRAVSRCGSPNRQRSQPRGSGPGPLAVLVIRAADQAVQIEPNK